jgi:hypothetical protein
MTFKISYIENYDKYSIDLFKACKQVTQIEEYQIDAFVIKDLNFCHTKQCAMEFLLPSIDGSAVSVVGSTVCDSLDEGIKEISKSFMRMINLELSNPFGLGFIRTHQVLSEPEKYLKKIEKDNATIYIVEKENCSYIVDIFHKNLYGYSRQISVTDDITLDNLVEFAVADSEQEIDKAVRSYEFLGLLLSKGPFYNC